MITSNVRDLCLPAPMEKTIKSLLGLINRRTMFQSVAADGNVYFVKDGSPVVMEEGRIEKLMIGMIGIPVAGESYSVVIEKSVDGGATYTAIGSALGVDSNSVAGEIIYAEGADITSRMGITDLEVPSGAILRAAIDYTAGGAPAPASGLTICLDIVPIK